MQITATEFKAKCLALIDRVHETGEPILITKRGRVVASLTPEEDKDQKPWLRLRGRLTHFDDPFGPAVDEADIEALR